MIRVLHVLGGLDRGGAETMVMNLYRAIDRTKVQFDFVIHTSSHQAYYSEIVKMGGRIYSFPAFNGINFAKLQKLWSQFFMEHPEYKILHSHVRSYASLYIPIAKKHGVKTIIHSHSTSSGSGIPSIVKRIMQFPLRYQADYLMACSNEAGRWLFGKKACEKSNYIFVPNAIDAKMYRYSEEKRNLYREEFGLQDKFVIGHVGRFHAAKNHMFLLEVFAEVAKRRSDAMLLLVGDGALRSSIEAKIKELQIEDRVILAGSRGDVAEIMSAMDVFVFPSLGEGLGIVAIEAQAAGLPCVCSEGVPRLARMTDRCVFLPFNQEDWVDTVLDYSNHYVDRNDTYKNIVNNGFDIQKNVERMQKFYYGLQETGECKS